MRAVATILLLIGASACAGQSHIRAYTARHREYDPGEFGEAQSSVSSGSLWQEGGRSLFADFRASQVGDLVTIDVDEDPRAIGNASTQMDRQSNFQLGIPGFFGLTTALQAAYPQLDPSRLIDMMSQSGFDGQGNTRRGSNIRARIAVRVRRLLPNGDLFIEGTKILMVNEEELHIYVSGVIRPQDIDPDNSISSSRIADAEIELTGRGDLTQNQRQGWLMRLLGEVNPL